MDDHNDIIIAVAKGDRVALKTLFDLYSSKIYNIAISYTQNIQDAEEITQDAFINIYRYASSFKGKSAVGTWIYRITVNLSLNYIKRKKRKPIGNDGLEGKDLPDFEHPGILLEKKENSKFLFKAIASLPENQKTAFILSFIEDLPRKETAEIMEISLKAVESLLQRAKKNLRKELESLYPHRRKSEKRMSKD